MGYGLNAAIPESPPEKKEAEWAKSGSTPKALAVPWATPYAAPALIAPKTAPLNPAFNTELRFPPFSIAPVAPAAAPANAPVAMAPQIPAMQQGQKLPPLPQLLLLLSA